MIDDSSDTVVAQSTAATKWLENPGRFDALKSSKISADPVSVHCATLREWGHMREENFKRTDDDESVPSSTTKSRHSRHFRAEH